MFYPLLVFACIIGVIDGINKCKNDRFKNYRESRNFLNLL